MAQEGRSHSGQVSNVDECLQELWVTVFFFVFFSLTSATPLHLETQPGSELPKAVVDRAAGLHTHTHTQSSVLFPHGHNFEVRTHGPYFIRGGYLGRQPLEEVQLAPPQ